MSNRDLLLVVMALDVAFWLLVAAGVVVLVS